MTETVDTVVIGAGVIGLAVGRRLAELGRQVIVLERNTQIGAETSSRNSEVIHAGIYYPTGSLKAELCVAGKQQLYAYCESKGVAHRRCGKLIVAIDRAQEGRLREIGELARANGVLDLRWLEASEVKAREPEVNAAAALWSPSTGIIDSHALMLALQGDLEHAGGIVALKTELSSARVERDGVRLVVQSGAEQTELKARTLINAAGLHASRVARSIDEAPRPAIPETRYAKGSYFIYGGASPFRHLVYPLPQDGGLGVHATLDLAGRVRFGPDVEWIQDIDYRLDAGRAPAFYEAVRSYWPDLPDGSLSPGYVGVRPKLHGPGEPPADFCIPEPFAAGQVRIAHLFGIESPGLTASLAIAEHVAALL